MLEKEAKIFDSNKVVYAHSSNWINQSTSNFIHVQPLKHEIFEVSNLTYLSDYFLNFEHRIQIIKTIIDNVRYIISQIAICRRGIF